MILIEKHDISKNHRFYKELDELCFKSKNLYNSTVYRIRQYYFDNKKYLSYSKVNKIFQEENQKDYRALPAKVAQEVQRLVDKNFKSFFSLMKLKNKGKYDKLIKLPRYLHKTKGRQILEYNKQAISFNNRNIEKGYFQLSGTNIKMKTKVDDIQFIRVVPKSYGITVEVGYKIEERKLKTNDNYASIDIGMNNLATVTFLEDNPFIINGKPVKSINQLYNKRIAKLKSEQSKHKGDEYLLTRKMKSVIRKRNNKIDDYFHKSSRYIVNQLVSKNISKLVIGKNTFWKQDINIGKKNNQNFVSIPFNNFINMLDYKCKLSGIEVIYQDESYTSKASFLNEDYIPDYKENEKIDYTFSGYRKYRGLYKIKRKKIFINADVNGSLNILRKYFQNNNLNIFFNIKDYIPTILTITEKFKGNNHKTKKKLKYLKLKSSLKR